MLPAFLITFREVVEASLIVTTILGILVKLNQNKGIKTVWTATGSAAAVSLFLLGAASIFGWKIQEIYKGKVEETVEGILMITAAIFITWAVFFLHNYLARYKTKLLEKVKETIERNAQKGLFILVFTAVFREGFEIILFLSTIFFSANPQSIFTGFGAGVIGGLLVSLVFFTATVKMPIEYAFRATSILLILFAAGLIARGVHEFAEIGLLPEINTLTLSIIPAKHTLSGSMLKAMFGITQKMDMIQLSLYSLYISFMSWWIFLRKSK